jgi:hypothetical protein
MKLRRQELDAGAFLALRGGSIVREERFQAKEFAEADPLPAVRAPQEREFCFNRLATIAAAA